jgi:hypothetical protein
MTKKRQILIATVATIFIALLVLIDWWTKKRFDLFSLIALTGTLAFFISLLISQSFRRTVLTIASEDQLLTKPSWRYLLALPIAFILSWYILLSDTVIKTPPVLQFEIIIVSSALGGLVLAAATIPKARDTGYDELLSIAQKLIVATILFVLSACFLFLVDFAGEFSPNAVELTSIKWWVSNICFWLTVLCYFPGVALFSLGIIDLVTALTHMRQRLNEAEQKNGD